MQDWAQAWQETVDSVGTDVAEAVTVAADVIDRSSVRRFCEPLEISSPIHYDDAAAREAGYEGIVAPLSAVTQAFVDPGLWKPGEPGLYTSPEPDAQPLLSGIGKSIREHLPGPRTQFMVVTDIEVERVADVYVGDHLTMRGQKLLSCVPKATKIGQGAFMRFESSCFNQRGEKVAVLRRGFYAYNPIEQSER